MILFDRIAQFDPEGGTNYFAIVPVKDGSTYSIAILAPDGDLSSYTASALTPERAIALAKAYLTDMCSDRP